VFGSGPVGVGAIRAGRVMSATQVIVVEPIKYRRDFAMKMGATAVLDPNVEGANIVERIREMCKGPNDRRLSGGASGVKWPFSPHSTGPGSVVAAAGVRDLPQNLCTQTHPTTV